MTLHPDLLDRLAGTAAEEAPQALLLIGPEGVGKAALAEALAARLLGTEPGRLDSHPDMSRLAPPADSKTGSIGVDEVRAAAGRLRLSPSRAGRRVLLAAPACAMTASAANAFLKTLEEPGADAVLLLVAHRLAALPATIRSRCWIVPVPAPAPAAARADLARRRPELADEALDGLLALADGSPGEAARFAEAGGLDGYREICRLAKPMMNGGRLDRGELAAWSETAAKQWDFARDALGAFARRLALTAGGAPPPPAIKGEDALMRRIAERAGLARCVAGAECVPRVLELAERAHLTPANAPARALRELEAALSS